jgi:hypothetical protein
MSFRQHPLLRFLPLVILIGLVSIFFYKLAFTDLILARGDTFSYFYPYWDVRNDSFRALELPLWTNTLFMGSPLLAEPQLGTFYPPNWFTAPFSVTDAIRYSILFHIFWAGLGMYLLFDSVAPKRPINIAGLIAGTLFAFSGFVGAHVEQINQLQGIAWMPWIFWLFQRAIVNIATIPRPQVIIWHIGCLAVAFALQFFTGHTQTLFMTGIGLGIFALFAPLSLKHLPIQRRYPKLIVLGGVILVVVVILTVLLVLPQFIPTLELTGMSNRGGSGFNNAQATAFSLPPHYVGRSLLPSYDGLLFGEYIGTLGVIGLGLGMVALLYPQTDSAYARWRWVWLAVAIIGLLFAFGRYNPIYFEFLANQRGFNLFRVPARWLSLFTLGSAMLGGIGIHYLLYHRQFRKRALLPIIILIGLMLSTRFLPSIAPSLSILPEDMTGSAIPTTTTFLFWGLALVGLALMAFVRLPKFLMIAFVFIELWGTSQIMTYNDLTPPEVYHQKRFTVSQLLALQEDNVSFGRTLSMSRLLFDVGDRDAIRARFTENGLAEDAIQIAFTAVKRQELLAANLPLTWGIPSVDGYGGGILPTMNYTQFTSLIMPESMQRTVDGRLSEALALPECRGACVPDINYIEWMGIEYLITDKIYDVWHNDVAYDTMFHNAGGIWQLNSPLNATHLHLLHTGAGLTIENATLESSEPVDTFTLSTFVLDAPATLSQVNISNSGDAIVYALSASNPTDEVFVQSTPQEWQRILSSDIKLYRYLGAWRANMFYKAQVFEDSWQGSEDALVWLQENPNAISLNSNTPLVLSTVDSPEFTIEPLEETATVLRFNVTTNAEGFFYLPDAYYPHWQATVNGESTPIYRANVMFRAIEIPAGEHEVVLQFVPMLWQQAIIAGAIMWLVMVGVLFVAWRKL